MPWTPESRWRPFCSERCKMIDLGAWASERYRVETPEAPESARRRRADSARRVASQPARPRVATHRDAVRAVRHGDVEVGVPQSAEREDRHARAGDRSRRNRSSRAASRPGASASRAPVRARRSRRRAPTRASRPRACGTTRRPAGRAAATSRPRARAPSSARRRSRARARRPPSPLSSTRAPCGAASAQASRRTTSRCAPACHVFSRTWIEPQPAVERALRALEERCLAEIAPRT